MKATDLRIGNWILNGINEEFQANGQTIANFMVGQATLGSFSPIKLTEDWLIKLGFGHYKGEEGTYQRYIDVENGFTTIEYIIDDGIICIDAMSVKCKYVHQLQNLYFSLTGEELLVK